MSRGALPEDPREICVICADMVHDDSDVSDDVLALLDKCADIEERAARCHDLRGLLCPFSETAELCVNNSPGPLYRAAKRAVDVVGGLVGSAMVVLLLPLIAAIVKIQSPGPIFFSQDRVGLDGRPFRLLKFRTMHENGPDEEARWASEEEERIFSFGLFMRRFHIDEFPQFFNVLRGNMSLVGPRPEQVPIVERLREKIPHYDERHCALPGLTGWAQMRHGYAGCELTTWIKIASDLYYVKHRNLLMDMSILLRTVPAVLIKEQGNNGLADNVATRLSEERASDDESIVEQRSP